MLSKKNIDLLFIVLIMLFNHVNASPKLDYTIRNHSIPSPLNGLTGNPVNGRSLVRDQNKGNCISCHQLPIPEEEFHGTIGPSLYAVAQRYTEAQLRIRVVDMKLIIPSSIMPGYYKTTDKINRIAPQFEGSTILSAQEVEDIIAYLGTLKSALTVDILENHP